MTYSILTMIELMGDDFPVLLNAVLGRIPILVVGEDVELIDDLNESLTHLCPHRHKLVFWRDFTSQEELFSVWEEEKHNYEVNRTIVCGLASNLRLALDRMSNFSAWIQSIPLNSRILGVKVTDDSLQEILNKVLSVSESCGVLKVNSPSSMNFSLMRPSPSSFELEKKIVAKILAKKRQSLERIKRLLRKSLRGVNVSEQIVEAVLQMDDESEKLTKDVFDEEINNYVHAARRAVMLLSRIRLARELGASTSLTERNLYEAIGWDGGELSDLIRFIMAEWHEDFSDCVKGGTLSGLGAWVDSMWGS